jgi:hypothetical protein
MDFDSLSLVLLESRVTEVIVATEVLEVVCSRVFVRSMPLVTVRLSLGSELELAVLATVVTAPIPLTEDFTTGSSLVLSSTRSCIGIGYVC